MYDLVRSPENRLSCDNAHIEKNKDEDQVMWISRPIWAFVVHKGYGMFTHDERERGGLVVESLTREREVGGLIPTGAVLCP